MEIGGKEVTFVETLPARLWWDLYPKLVEIKVKKGDRLIDKFGWDMSVELCRATVASWEHEGDPHDAAAYERLDFWAMIELVGQAYTRAVELLTRGGAGQLGESERTST